MFNQRKQLQQLGAAATKDKERDIKLSEKRDAEYKAATESLNQHSEALRETMTNIMKSIDEKMKDVRSLLLHQSQVPKETEKWIEKLERVEKTNLLLLQKGFDNVTKKLDEAAETRRQTLAAMRGRQRLSDNSEMQLMEMDNVAVILGEQQRQTRNTVMITGLLLCAVMCAVQKFM